MFAPPLLSAHYVRGPFTLTVKAGKGETSTTALVGTKYIQKKLVFCYLCWQQAKISRKSDS